jgi:type VI secretion system protein ImpL
VLRFLKTLLSVLIARWFLSLVGLVILALVVWYFGALLALADWRPLESELSRLVTILVLTFIWGAGNLLAQRRARRANEAFVSELAKAPPLPGPADEEIKEVSERFNAALAELKKRRLHGRRYLAELPWYLMIGPPGSGKTTALLQSGLRFPLAEGNQGRELRGVGGTRNCDWFFTEEAVLIDTAGRYTTQESHAEADRAAWQGFLDLLAKHRRRQPISGVLIAFPADDLLRADPALLAQHARAIRNRLDEITGTLGLRFPAYLLVTKGDLIAGFNEFFADLSERDREQVLGFTLPIDPAQPAPPARGLLERELDRLVARLEERVLPRLHAERDLERRALVFRFPDQLAALKSRLVALAEQIFYESSFAAPVLLRGLYVTSGTQEGTPIDRLMQAMAASFGVEQTPPPVSRGNRSFFLTRLLREVVFAEAGLAARDSARERRERWLERAAWALAGVVLLGAALAWGAGFLQSRNEAVALSMALQQARLEMEPVAKNQLTPADVASAPVLRALDLLHGLPVHSGSPVVLRLGLSAGSALNGAADAAYRRSLERIFLPRLALRLEEDLWGRIGDPEYVLQGLKVYLMLIGRAELDRDLIETWFRVVDRPEAEGLTPEDAERLAQHRAALLDLLPEIVDRPEPDSALVAQAQKTLASIPLARRAYDALLNLPEVRGLPPWNPAEHAGPNALRVLTRPSGKPLGEGIAGIYTFEGFHEHVLPRLKDVAAATAVENWVLDAGAPSERSQAEIEQLQADVLKLYYDDYIAVWEQLLADVTLAPFTDLRSAVDGLKDLSGPSSALKLLLTAIVGEVELTRAPKTNEAQEAAADAALKSGTKLLGKTGGAAAKLAALAGKGQAEAVVPGAPVAARFSYLVAVVDGSQGAPPAIDDAIGVLGRLFQELQAITASPNPEKAILERGGIAGVVNPLAQEAKRLPQPLDGWLGGVAQQASALSGGAVGRQLNAIWQADILPVCTKALVGRFPFALESGVDVSLADFGRLFGPGALIDGFVNANLQQLVDTARRPWRWRADLELSNAALAQLERARRIRDGMFAGGANPQANFTLQPIDLDAGSARVLLDLNGQQVSYRHDASHPTTMVWPGQGPSNIVRLAFFPVAQGVPVELTREGAWSWFRLLREGMLEPSDQPDLFHLTLSAGGHWARFELHAGSVYNPFDLALLGGFQCPARM